MPVDDLDDAHDDDYLIMMTELEPLLDDVAPGDGGVSLVQLMHIVMIAMIYDG